LINSGGELLRLKQSALLQGASLSVASLGNIEDNRVRMELRRDITAHGSGRIVLEFGGNEHACRLRWMTAADAGLGVTLNLVEGNADALPVRFAYTLIATHKRGQ
jgi:hypothetical protein